MAALGTLAQALRASVHGIPGDYQDLGQAALEVATVFGYGRRADPARGNADEGDYFIVVYCWSPDASDYVPFTVTFTMSGPQGSLGAIRVGSPLGFSVPPVETLYDVGLWPLA